MIGITTVISVEGTPVVRFAGQPPEAVIIHARTKSLRTGMTTDTRFPRVIPREDGPCIEVSSHYYTGDPVAYTVEAVDMALVAQWFEDDAVVPYDEWLSRRNVLDIMTPASPEPLSEPMTTQAQEPAEEPAPEEPEDEGDDMPGGVMGCAVSELRTALIGVLRQQGRAMLHNRMRSLLTKGAVRRAGYTGERHPETVWEVVRMPDRRHLIRRPEHRAVYDVISAHPGITAREVCDYLPSIPRGQVVGAICALNGRLIRSCDTIRRRGGDIHKWEAMP